MFPCDRARRLSLPSKRQKAFHTFRARTQRRPRRRKRRASVPVLFAKAEILAPPHNPSQHQWFQIHVHFIVSELFLNRMSETKTSTCSSTFLPLVILCEACSSTALSYRGCNPELPLTSMWMERGVFWRCFPATARGDLRFQANGKSSSTHFPSGPNEGPDDGSGALPSGSFLRKQKS